MYAPDVAPRGSLRIRSQSVESKSGHRRGSTLRLGFGALATPLVGLGGGMKGMSMGLAIAGAAVLALGAFALVARLDRGRDRTRELQPGTCADMPVC